MQSATLPLEGGVKQSAEFRTLASPSLRRLKGLVKGKRGVRPVVLTFVVLKVGTCSTQGERHMTKRDLLRGKKRSLQHLGKRGWELHDLDGERLVPVPTPESKLANLA